MQVGQTSIRMNRSGGELMRSSWRQVLLIWTVASSICMAQSSPQGSMRVNRASDASTERPERDGHQKPSSSYNMLLSAACTPISPTRRTAELPRAKSHLIIDSQLSKAAYRLDEVNQPVGDQDGSNYGEAATPERSAPLSPQILPTNELYLPLKTKESPGEIDLGRNGDLLSLSFRDAALREVLGVLAESQGLNLICSRGADTKITGTFHSITFEDA
ncbi:MAG: hypothetical protein H7Z17_14890, partial [Fuerstia sp.]|nr:hypothetical protein [Fuerstiella sp.]